MKLFEHPMELGEASAIEPGPWHYGADYVAVYFDAEPDRLKQLIPEPFEVDGRGCVAYVCEIVSISDSKRGMVSSQPDRTHYHEAAIGVRSSLEGKRGVFFPIMWVDTEWALLRGLLNGYQKRLADHIAMTKLHPLNPGLAPIGRGTEMSGFCVKGPERTLRISVKVDRRVSPEDLQSFGATFGRRVFPKTEQSQGSVSEAVEILKWNAKVSDVWLGEGSMETTLELGNAKTTGGAVYRSGFTIAGSRVLATTQESLNRL
jgi:acetoacetate decarboxylase